MEKILRTAKIKNLRLTLWFCWFFFSSNSLPQNVCSC